MSKRSTNAALKDIREAIERIQRYVGTLSLDGFLTNTEKQDAVVRNFEIIGEAAKSLPSEYRKKHKHVEWSEMAGFRDKLIHHYFGLNLRILWDVVQQKLPQVYEQIGQLLGDEE
jgi:uncharacterized protein with HEPN domain